MKWASRRPAQRRRCGSAIVRSSRLSIGSRSTARTPTSTNHYLCRSKQPLRLRLMPQDQNSLPKRRRPNWTRCCPKPAQPRRRRKRRWRSFGSNSALRAGNKSPKLTFIRPFVSLPQAKRKHDEEQRKRDMEDREREKLRVKKERERIRAEMEKDKLERLAAQGKAPPPAAEDAPVDPYKKRLLSVKNAMRKIYSAARFPEGAARAALEMAQKILTNIHKNPTEDKFRGIRTTNETVQRILLSKNGATELFTHVGFVEDGERLVLKGDVDMEWLTRVLDEIAVAIQKGPFY
mmetsp:Transcript_38137/g.89173  ORF Transcript_38137/g.89173 Transcript_38137/m.89173 type:complete len:291 (+) Transcript_38137:424-1296(+)